MSVYLDNFRHDPVAYANQHPITIAGPGVSHEYKSKAFQHDQQTFTGYQVRGGERIYWFDIGLTKGDRTMHQVQLQVARDDELEPAYWLPWAQNEIIRTALRPSLKASGALSGVDPDYFFTAPLTGCSVFVEGPRAAPTVYHANAYTHGGTFGGTMSRSEFVELQRSKIEEMQQRFAAFSNQQEKRTRTGRSPGATAGEVTMQNYLYSHQFPRDMEEVISKLTGGKFTKLEVVGQQLHVTHAEGTVFGVREHGEWTFYFQKRVRIQHLMNDYQSQVSSQSRLRYGVSWLNPVDWWSWAMSSWRIAGEQWLPVTCQEFWPNGVGQIVIR